MTDIKPERGNAGEHFIYANKNSDGTLICPAGYVIRKCSDDTWRCEGGHHEYRLDEETIAYDKFGAIMIKKNNEADEKEGLK